jgi:hypothetical protein
VGIAGLLEGDLMTAVAERVLYAIPEVMARLSMSRSVVYEQIRAGRLETVHQGRRCYVTGNAIERYVALLESEAEHRGGAA